MKTKLLFVIQGLFLSALLIPLSSLHAQPCIANTNSLAFDGSTSAVRINTINGLDITGEITIEAWVYPHIFASGAAGNSIFCKHAWSGSDKYGYVLRSGGNGVLSFNIAGVDSSSVVDWREVLSYEGALTVNNWHHVAGVFTGSALLCYVDGIQVGSAEFTGTINPLTGIKARIGALSDTVWSMSRYFDGIIDEVRVWNRALTQSEISSNMNDHINPATSTGLVGYWRLNEGTGTTIADLGTGNNSGTSLSAIWLTVVPFNNAPPTVPVITYSGGQLHSSSATGNQWYFESSLITGATQQNYTPTVYGNYSVNVTINGCSTMSAPFNYNTTGIQEESSNDIQVFPVPSDKEITVCNSKGSGIKTFGIYNQQGQLMMKGDLCNEPFTIDISKLSAGVYYIKLSGDRQIIVHRIIRSRN